MKKYLVFILLAFILLSATGAAEAEPVHRASSCSLEDVQAAIASASPEDTVVVPSGSATWYDTLTITKGINLIGAGIDETVITQGSDVSLIKYQPSSDNLPRNYSFRISGFTFDLAGRSLGHAIILSSSNSLTLQTKIRIDHNRFYNSRAAGAAIYNLGMMGVADNNAYDQLNYPLRVGRGDAGSGLFWWDNFRYSYGTAENFYVEDNTFTGIGKDMPANAGCWEDGETGGRYVFRYNTANLSYPRDQISALFDMHGNVGEGTGALTGTVGVEIYGNQVNGNSQPVSPFLDQRGGMALVFGNNLNDVTGSAIRVREEASDSLVTTTNPQPQHVSNSYQWNNRLAYTIVLPTVEGQHVGDTPLINRDFFPYNESFDGTSGTGCGTLAARPATCAPGVGYWATEQSCSSIDAANVGAHPAVPIKGTLYKCTAPDTWTAYYTPYTYPHPLRAVIPANRRIDWQAGIPGGIPNYPLGVNVKDYGAVGDGVVDDYPAVAAAIAGCPDGKAVYFPEGTYNLSQTIVIKKPQSIVLRGAGPDKTKLISYSTTGSVIRISYDYAGGVTHNVIGGMDKGSNNLTLDSVSSLNIGDHLQIQQINDPAVILGNINTGQWQGQIFRITGINGNVVTTDRPLYYTYSSAFSPQVRQLANMTTGCGVEDLFVEMRGTGLYNIYMYYAAQSWVKNVESYNAKNSNIKLTDVYQCEVRDSYIHDYSRHIGYEYGVQLCTLTTDSLVENNSIQGGSTAVMVQGGANGNVIGYNYSVYGFYIGYPDNNFGLTAGVEFHGDNPNMNLVEGNTVMQIAGDDTWGSGRSNTFFRNWVTRFCYTNYNNTPALYGLTAARIDASNYGYNFVGNVLTRPSDVGDTKPSHAVLLIGRSSNANHGCLDPVDDLQTEATLIRHGNFDYVSGTTQWDPNITDHNLPNSLYLKEKPAFFGNIPWPPIGPDVAGFTNDIPAKYCYENGLMPNCLEVAGVVYGDVSGDGTITAYDAALALQLGRGALEAGLIAQRAVGLQ